MNVHVLAVPRERINSAIHLVRGQKIMLSTNLASLYGVSAKVLMQAVKRNIDRFPPDFMFQLKRSEWRALQDQLIEGPAVSPRATPYAFTEQGVAMLSSVLRSSRAVQVNIEIMRAFVRLRQILLSHADLARKLDELEKKYDAQFRMVFDAIRALMSDSEEHKKKRTPIGYKTEEQGQLEGSTP